MRLAPCRAEQAKRDAIGHLWFEALLARASLGEPLDEPWLTRVVDTGLDGIAAGGPP